MLLLPPLLAHGCVLVADKPANTCCTRRAPRCPCMPLPPACPCPLTLPHAPLLLTEGKRGAASSSTGSSKKKAKSAPEPAPRATAAKGSGKAKAKSAPEPAAKATAAKGSGKANANAPPLPSPSIPSSEEGSEFVPDETKSVESEDDYDDYDYDEESVALGWCVIPFASAFLHRQRHFCVKPANFSIVKL